MARVDEKLLDAKITKALYEDKNVELLTDLIDVDEELRSKMPDIQKCLAEGKPIPLSLLMEILIARDKKVLGLKNYQISTVSVEDLHLDDELMTYNGEITYKNENVKVATGKDKDGKDVVLIYYLDDDWVNRQQRTYNSHGDVESMHRHTIFDNGKLDYIDNALISYQYDNQGRKKASLYQDDLAGMRYYEYDEDGSISLVIEPDAVIQRIKDGTHTYTITDGLTLTPNDEAYHFQEIKRDVSGDIPQDKRNQLLSEIDPIRRINVLNILKEVEPVFKSLSTDVQKNEQDVRKRMDRVVTWFTGFSRRLKIDPKLATQDDAVMSAMKSAVSKTVGKTADAQTDMATSPKDENEYEGEDYGDN